MLKTIEAEVVSLINGRILVDGRDITDELVTSGNFNPVTQQLVNVVFVKRG